MSFSDKPNDEFSQEEPEQQGDINEDYTNVEDKQNSFDNNNNVSSNNVHKKNRVLQYYKFLFYSMKTEIKVHDFLKLVRNSNTAEISFWTMSVIIFANIPKDFQGSKVKYSGVFIWFHILHLLRGFLGMYVGYKLPRSYQVIDILQNTPDEKLAKTLFNDIMRETLLNNVVLVIKKQKVLIFIYFISTIINLLIDIIDFLVVLSKLSSCPTNVKVIFITYLLIAIIYLVIDFSYIFWFGQMNYIFPPKYLEPINSLYRGVIDKAMMTFKLIKGKTDVVSEAKAQRKEGPFVKGGKDMNNGGVNLLECIMKNSLGVYDIEEHDKYDNNINNQGNNKEDIRYDVQNNLNNYPNSNEILN